MTSIVRRNAIALAAAALTSLALPGVALAQTEIRISTAAPTTAPLTDAFNKFKESLEAKFPGELSVSVHAASTLFRQGTEIPAMQRGNLDAYSGRMRPVIPI